MTAETLFIDQHLFTHSDQERFSRLSGDVNPMHMDPVAARRTQAGLPAVHGIHIICYALEYFCRAQGSAGFHGIAGLQIRFEKFLTVGQAFSASFVEGLQASRIEIRSAGTRLITVNVYHELPIHNAIKDDGGKPEESPLDALETAAADLDFDEAKNSAGSFEYHENSGEFQSLEAIIGSANLGGLYALSRLVGMKVPGLHSILSELYVEFLQTGGAPANRIDYHVSKAHPHFRLFDIDFRSARFKGQIKAFLRQRPVQQSDYLSLKAQVTDSEFAGVCALVIGGSRGLGEVTAKLLAAGGGKVAITYRIGSGDAERVANEIQNNGGVCVCRQFDATAPDFDMLENLPFEINQVYYFATSKIFGQGDAIFSSRNFRRFQEIYVDGFWRVCEHFSRSGSAALTAFYPSTVAIDERPRGMTEYTMAKTAAEILCGDINRFMPGITTIVERLPRLLTDQTATVTPVKSPSADDVMLEVVRTMAGAR